MINGAIVYDSAYLSHDTGTHIESKGRLESIIEGIKLNENANKIPLLRPFKATYDQLRFNHDPLYIKNVKEIATTGGGWLDPDTYCSPKSYDAAVLAVGGVICAVDSVLGDVANVFALVRPPGHHATYNKSMGFCIFNNVACAAKYALKVQGVQKILIVDWDVHHGNGTQESFYDDPRVLYFSTHQRPLFPGTGDLEEVGRGNGEGFNVSVPLPQGVNDDGYFYIYDELLIPIANQFKPELVFISAGQDIHFADPIGGMSVTSRGFNLLTERVKSVSCDGQLIAVLEGGYDLTALSNSTLSILGALADFAISIEERHINEGVTKQVEERVRKVKAVQSEYWEV